MKKLALIAAAVVALAACEPDGFADQVARKEAKSVVNPILEERFPGVPVAPYTDCVIDAASSGEILQIAAASVTGPTPSVTSLVIEIAQRPRTIQCAAEAALAQALL
jgi:hypothetical protein